MILNGDSLIRIGVTLVLITSIALTSVSFSSIALSDHRLVSGTYLGGNLIKLGTNYYVERILFEYNFDNYSTGIDKLPKGWLVAWSGLEYGIVSNYHHSPPNSLMAEGEYGWTCVLYRPFKSRARFIGIDAWVLLTPPKRRECIEKNSLAMPIALFCKKCATWGLYLGFVQFGLGDKKVYALWGAFKNFTVVGSFEFYKWIHILFIIDREKGAYNLWLNGKLVARDVPVPALIKERMYDLSSVSFSSGWCEAKYYLDDIKVFELIPIKSPGSIPTLIINQTITSVITKVRTTTLTKPITTTVTKTKTKLLTTVRTSTRSALTTLLLTKTKYLTVPVTTTVTKVVTMYLNTYATATKTVTVTKFINLRSNLPSIPSIVVSAIIILIGIILFAVARRS